MEGHQILNDFFLYIFRTRTLRDNLLSLTRLLSMGLEGSQDQQTAVDYRAAAACRAAEYCKTAAGGGCSCGLYCKTAA